MIVAAPYQIDSRLTLAAALPAGTTVTVYRGGVAVLTDITLSGTGPFWFTELFDPDAPRAAFDAGYGGAVENYAITLTGPGGNPLAFETTVDIESVISKDGFSSETVLDDITLAAVVVAAPAVSIDASQVFWDAVSGATGYKVYESTIKPYCGPADAENVYSVTVPSYSLPADTSHNYYYFVRAVNSSAQSGNSNRVGRFTFQLVPGQ